MELQGARPAVWAYWPANHLEVTSGGRGLGHPGGGHRADDVVLEVVQDVVGAASCAARDLLGAGNVGQRAGDVVARPGHGPGGVEVGDWRLREDNAGGRSRG